MASLETLPLEIKDQIFSYLEQNTLQPLTNISPALFEATAIHLYRSPKFRSSYRFAQFVTTVSHSRHYADMVRRFILQDHFDEDNDLNDIARWIEWKYRNVSIYATMPPPRKSYYPGKQAYSYLGKHPRRSRLLNKDYGIVPVGSIIQTLTACRNLREVNLQVYKLEEDFLIKSPSYPPTALSAKIFVSEVSRSWTHNSTDIEHITANAITAELPNLPHLEHLRIRNAAWLTTKNVETILFSCPRLKYMDFSGSGGFIDSNSVRRGAIAEDKVCWATGGNRDRIARRLGLVLTAKA